MTRHRGSAKSGSQERHPIRRGAECSSPGCCGAGGVGRREFIKLAGAGAVALAASGTPLAAFAGPFPANSAVDHFVPADKKLKPEWIRMLSARGERTFYRGADLATIGMPTSSRSTASWARAW